MDEPKSNYSNDQKKETARLPLSSSAQPLKDISCNPTDSSYSVSFAIGGMTCSACSNAITEALSTVDGICSISISLVNHCGAATVSNRAVAHRLISTIEECGFEASISDVIPVVASPQGPRTIMLQINGLESSAHHDQLNAVLTDLQQDSVFVVNRATKHRQSILTLEYQPDAPKLTIRHIISKLESVSPSPATVSVHHPPSLEDMAAEMSRRYISRLVRRLAVTLIAAIPSFVIGIVYMSLVPAQNPGKVSLMSAAGNSNISSAEWSLFAISTPVMFYGASIFHQKAFKEIRLLWSSGSKVPVLRRFVKFGSMNLLISCGITVAYLSSIALLVLASVQDQHSKHSAMRVSYFDTVVFLTLFLLIGRWIEATTKSKASKAVASLMSLRAPQALLVVEKQPFHPYSSSSLDQSLLPTNSTAQLNHPVQLINVDLLEVGDVVRIPCGQSPPADALLVSGVDGSAFNESMLTGEDKPVQKHEGGIVLAGSINVGPAVDAMIVAIDGQTMLEQIITIVREGHLRRAPIERVADLITGYFVPAITFCAIATWIIWLTLGYSGVLPDHYLDIPLGGWVVWSLQFSIAVFVVACPCGIGLAAPTALMVGAGLAAKHGILARGGGEAFQEMSHLNTVVFDKTGTLTRGGNPRVVEAHLAEKGPEYEYWSAEGILTVASSLEQGSAHPLASAIRDYCEVKGASPAVLEDITEVPGKGLKGTSSDLHALVLIGNESWLNQHAVTLDSDHVSRANAWRSKGYIVIFLALRSVGDHSLQSVSMFAIADPLRPEAKAVINWMQSTNLEIWMITGDNHVTAQTVASAVGIPSTRVLSGVLPHEKADAIRKLQGSNTDNDRHTRRIVAMVGDGINDAPALSVADVGIAIGSGSDAAASTASFILVSSDLQSLVTLVHLSRKVFRRVVFNFGWAMVYNIVALPIAAGILYPVGQIRLDPVWASLAMALSSISVVCSSLALKAYRPPRVTHRDGKISSLEC